MKERFEFDGIPFYVERVDNNDSLMVFSKDDLLVGIIDTSTSKQSMSTENLETILSDRIHELHKLLTIAGVKL